MLGIWRCLSGRAAFRKKNCIYVFMLPCQKLCGTNYGCLFKFFFLAENIDSHSLWPNSYLLQEWFRYFRTYSYITMSASFAVSTAGDIIASWCRAVPGCTHNNFPDKWPPSEFQDCNSLFYPLPSTSSPKSIVFHIDPLLSAMQGSQSQVNNSLPMTIILQCQHNLGCY